VYEVLNEVFLKFEHGFHRVQVIQNFQVEVYRGTFFYSDSDNIVMYFCKQVVDFFFFFFFLFKIRKNF